MKNKSPHLKYLEMIKERLSTIEDLPKEAITPILVFEATKRHAKYLEMFKQLSWVVSEEDQLAAFWSGASEYEILSETNPSTELFFMCLMRGVGEEVYPGFYQAVSALNPQLFRDFQLNWGKRLNQLSTIDDFYLYPFESIKETRQRLARFISEHPSGVLPMPVLPLERMNYQLHRYAVRLNEGNRWFSPYHALELLQMYGEK